MDVCGRHGFGRHPSSCVWYVRVERGEERDFFHGSNRERRIDRWIYPKTNLTGQKNLCCGTPALTHAILLEFFTAPSFVPKLNGVVAPMPKFGHSNIYSTRRNDIKMMPIGVPKVAYRVPGSQQADWYVSKEMLLVDLVVVVAQSSCSDLDE
jgi:hypothetical protein